jgi:hypothetical protein
MTEAEVIKITREYLEGLFPKFCNNCNRCFATLREYILTTQRLDPMLSYDAELGNWNTSQPIGTVVCSNCPCGTTLSLTTENMLLPQRLLLLNWIRCEMERRALSSQELLTYLRDETRKQVLAEPDQGDN